ncbi:MAG: hypothetical protein VB143_02105 [Burkholderia sp.]
MSKPEQPAAHDPMLVRTRVLMRYLRPLWPWLIWLTVCSASDRYSPPKSTP